MKKVNYIRPIFVGVFLIVAINILLFFGMTIRPAPNFSHYHGSGRIIDLGFPLGFGFAFKPGYKVELDRFNFCHPYRNTYNISELPKFSRDIFIGLESKNAVSIKKIKNASISLEYTSARGTAKMTKWNMVTTEGVENEVYIVYPENYVIEPEQVVVPINISFSYIPETSMEKGDCGSVSLTLKSGGYL